MQAADPGRVRSSINVTPLVDVVLVLLIIFMVVAPQLQAGADVRLPTTERPPETADDATRVLVALEHGGGIWVDDAAVAPGTFVAHMRALAAEDAERKVVVKGDARLTFGAVRDVLFAVESAGFADVGLVAARREDLAPGTED